MKNMGDLVKIVPAGKLPKKWREELGFDANSDDRIMVTLKAVTCDKKSKMAELEAILKEIRPVRRGRSGVEIIRDERARDDVRDISG